uniref:hypothetical protein n=1 Tax=Paractinoplanes polyasparticus TaxID=2856853 RepID=UPI001C845327|nr:hypothetical protein [Actinoplanes polyasparticus]
MLDGEFVVSGGATVVLRAAGGPLDLPAELIAELGELRSAETGPEPANEGSGSWRVEV